MIHQKEISEFKNIDNIKGFFCYLSFLEVKKSYKYSERQ